MTKFVASQFTPTQFDSAADKAKFANHFVRFVESGFKETLFYDWFYRRLSMTFGHIAHYNRAGFYSVFFSNPQNRCDFLAQTIRWGCYGDAKFTYSDVERKLQNWLANSGVVAKVAGQRDHAVEQAERNLLAKLQAKYPTVYP